MNLLDEFLARDTLFHETQGEILERPDGGIFSDFGWNPDKFKEISSDSYLDKFLKQESRELHDEREKFGNEELYNFSAETFTKEGPNCWAFALKSPFNPKTGETFTKRPAPGEIAHGFNTDIGDRDWDLWEHGTTQEQKDFYTCLMRNDVESLGMSIKEVPRNYKPAKNEWVIALATSETLQENPNSICDFHFYRREPSGAWLHKPGITEVTDTDAKGNLILDPEKCERGEYTHFLGYFAISDPKGVVA